MTVHKIKKISVLLMICIFLFIDVLISVQKKNRYKRYIHPGWFNNTSFSPINGKFYKYKLRIQVGDQENTITYKLDKQLPAGRYYFFMHSYYIGPKPRHFNNPVNFIITLNGSSGIIPWPHKKSGKRGWLKTEINTESAGDSLIIKVFPVKNKERYELVLNLLYLTSDPEDYSTSREIIFTADSKQDQKEGDNENEICKNYLTNAGFEIGWGHGWRFMNGNTGHAVNHRYWLHENVPQGKYALNIPVQSRLQSNIINLKKGSYTLSAFVRKKSQVPFRLQLWTYEDVRKYKFKNGYTSSHKASEDWQQFKVVFNVRSGRYVLVVTGGVDVDAIQLVNAATPEPFRQSKPVEVGMTTTQTGRAYRLSDKKNAILRVSAHDNDIKEAEIWFRIVDFFGNELKKTHKTVLLNGGTYSENIDLSVNKCGIFRVDMGVGSNEKRIQEEMSYTVHPDISENFFSKKGFIGFYDALGDDKVPAMITAGLNLSNSINANPSGSWRALQPEKNKFNWQDNYIVNGRKAGMEIYTLLDPRHFPGWVKKAPVSETVRLRPLDIKDWEDFVFKLVSHYKKLGVRGYELLDDQDHYYSTEDHLAYVKSAYKSIKKADPEAFVITWAWLSKKTLDSASEEQKDKIYRTLKGKSDILFMGGAEIAKKYDSEMWCYRFDSNYSIYQKNTVSAVFTAPHHDRTYFRDKTPRTIILDIEQIAKHSASRFFRYEAHIANNHRSIFDYDGVFLPVGVAYSILENHIRGKKYVKKFERSEGLTFHKFADKENSIFVSWANGGNLFNMILPEKRTLFIVKDFMGNNIKIQNKADQNSLVISRYPVYFQVASESSSGFEALLKAAEIKMKKSSLSAVISLANERKKLLVDIGNPGRKEKNIQMKVSGKSSLLSFMHPEITSEAWDFTVMPGKSKNIEIPIFSKERTLNGNVEFIVNKDNETSIWSVPVNIQNVAAVDKDFKLLSSSTRCFPIYDKNGYENVINYEGHVSGFSVKTAFSSKYIYFWFNIRNKHNRSNLLEGIVSELKLYFDLSPVQNKELQIADKSVAYLNIKLNQQPRSNFLILQGREIPVNVFIGSISGNSRNVQIKIPAKKLLERTGNIYSKLIGFNFAYHSGVQAETFFDAWADWSDHNSKYPELFNYLYFNFNKK
ncbi:MAG: hypothetical protein ACYTFY_10645 [Planctomycetota bacterium]|jgi:hypothetical protein